MAGITGVIHKDQYTFFIISRSVLLIMRNVSGKFVGKIKQLILFSVTFFENRAFCQQMWRTIVKPDRPQMTKWCKRFACWITKATNTKSEYIILNAFPLQE